MGMLLDLTGQLTSEPRLVEMARKFNREQLERPEMFFRTSESERERLLAERRTPAAARKWGFLMNMSEESFRSVLEKYGCA